MNGVLYLSLGTNITSVQSAALTNNLVTSSGNYDTATEPNTAYTFSFVFSEGYKLGEITFTPIAGGGNLNMHTDQTALIMAGTNGIAGTLSATAVQGEIVEKAVSLDNLAEFKANCDRAYSNRSGGGGGGGDSGDYVTIGNETQTITGIKRFTNEEGVFINTEDPDYSGTDTKYKSYSIQGNYAGDSPFILNFPYLFPSATFVVKNSDGAMNLSWVKNASALPENGVYLICSAPDPDQATQDNMMWIVFHSTNSINNSPLFPYPDGTSYYYRVLKNGTIARFLFPEGSSTNLDSFSYIRMK